MKKHICTLLFCTSYPLLGSVAPLLRYARLSHGAKSDGTLRSSME